MVLNFTNAKLIDIAVHYIGNKYNDENMIISDSPIVNLPIELQSSLTNFALSGFKLNESYQFYHESELELNNVYTFVSRIFKDSDNFFQMSINIAKHLYENSEHPQIKSGELYIIYLNQCILDEDVVDAIAIIKSESKDSYLKTQVSSKDVSIKMELGMSMSKLDKGCLIFNTEKEQGYKVAMIDQTNRSHEAVYWKDDFLKLKVRNDNYNQTNNVLGVYKNFVTQKLDNDFEVSKADKIDLLNKSIKYFKEKENFDLDEFSNEVIGNEQGIASFLGHKKSFEEEFETAIPDSFDISGAAVKKQARTYKSVLKLDKNFHIYIHGNKDLIEKGFDEGKSMNYYKVYFKEEA